MATDETAESVQSKDRATLADRRPPRLALALFALTFVVFLPVGENGFINFDTPEVLTENPLVNQGFTVEGVKRAFTEGQWNLWLPLTSLSHMLDCELFGLDPRGHHLMNAGIHALSAAALFLVLHGMTGCFWPAAFAAALFAIHPLRVESVAWAAERKDTLGALFWILTMGAYGRYVRGASRGSYATLLAVFALGLMAKPTIVTLPFALLLLDVWPLNRVKWKSGHDVAARLKANLFLLREKAPLFGGVAALSVVTMLAQQATAVVSMEEISLGARMANAAVSFVRYLGKTVWPEGLGVFYPLPENGWGGAATIGAFGVLALLSWLAFRNRKAAPWLPMMWLWFLGTSIPNIGLVQSGVQAMADRFSYIPSIGLSIATAWGGAALLRRLGWERARIGLVAGVALLILAVLTRKQIAHWRDSVTLFTRTIAVTQDNPIAQHNLATALLERGELASAQRHFLKALEFDPGHVEANIGAGITLADSGRLEEAAMRYREALASDPANLKAGNNLGSVLVSLERGQEAVAILERAREIGPDDADVLNNLGLAWASLGDGGRAMEFHRLAVEAAPEDIGARQNLGVAELDAGFPREAEATFREALRQEPKFAPALAGLGMALREMGRSTEAGVSFREALALEPGLTPARSGLIEVLTESGDHRRAVAELQTAMRLVPEDLENPSRFGWILSAAPEAELRNGAMAEKLVGDLRRIRGTDSPQDLDLLAAALAEQGRFEEAVREVTNAIRTAGEAGEAGDVEGMKRRLELYRAGKPFRLQDGFP